MSGSIKFSERMSFRIRKDEVKAIEKAVKKDEWIDNQSGFVRVAVIRELRRRGLIPEEEVRE